VSVREPFEVLTRDDGTCEAFFAAGTLAVDEVVEELDHEPNGYFWEGVARWLFMHGHEPLAQRIELDAEAGTFVAVAEDREALEALMAAMQPYLRDAERLRALIVEADAADHDFDD